MCGGLPAGNKRRTPLPASRYGGPALEQLPSGLGTIPGGIRTRFRCQKVIGNRRQQLLDILDIFSATALLQRRFISADAFDECAPEHRPEPSRH